MVESEEEKWHDFDGGSMEWVTTAGEEINDMEKEGALQAQELKLERMGVACIEEECSWGY